MGVQEWGKGSRRCFCFLLVCVFVVPAGKASGLVTTKRWQVLGFFENNTVLRDSNGFQYRFLDPTSFVQVRNTFKLQADLRLHNKIHLCRDLDLRIERMFASYRAAYDAIYDLRSFPIENEFRIGRFELGEEELKLENDLREIYIDLSLWQLWARIGRQIVSWGETEGFRILDIVNPLDTSYNLFFILPEENRIPLYMGRFILTMPDLKPFSNTDLELLVIPDVRPTLQAPGGAPYAIPLPFSLPTIAGIIPILNPREDVPAATFKDTEFGFRLTSLIDRFNFSLAYFYGIQDNPGARLDSVDIMFQAGTTLRAEDWSRLTMQDILDAIQQFGTDFEARVNLDMIHPYVNAAGFSYNFFEDFTSTTFRGEFTYTWDLAVIDLGSSNLVGRVDRVDWAVGFDRNTWIHFLNKSATFLFSLQLIGRHYLDPLTQVGSLMGFPVSVDLYRQNSYLVTFLARTTYHHGFIIPTLFLAVDPDGMLIQNFMITWIVNNWLSFTLSEYGNFGREVGDIERDPFLHFSEVSLKTVIQF